MHSADFIALLPLLITTGTVLLVMIAIAIRRHRALNLVLTLCGLAAAFVSLPAIAGRIPRQVTPLLVIDTYALIFIGLIVVSSAGVALLANPYLERHESPAGEFYVLLLTATLGAEVLASSSHFASFFLGLEILSVSLYAMIGYLTGRRHPLEAGIKYLVLAAASAAFLLFGMALVYADSGTMDFSRIASAQSATWFPLMTVVGTTLIVTGVGFKLALVPFHLWTPDVYEGAPAPVTAFVATVSKTGVFAVLLRYYTASAPLGLFGVLAAIAIASMLAGNLLALRQNNVKRILAYSSISHLGYVLVALLAAENMRSEAVLFYLIAYSVTIIGAFAVVTALSGTDREADDIEDYRGLFWRRPLIGSIFTVVLLSLAGMPATAGFIGKFYVVAAGAAASKWLLVIVLVVGSAIGLFYYLRVIAAMFATAPLEPHPARRASAMEAIVLVTFAVLVLWLGIYPAPILGIIGR